MSDDSSRTVLVIIGVVFGVLLLGLVVVTGLVGMGLFFWVARQPAPQLASPPVVATQLEPPVADALPDASPALEQPAEPPVWAPVPVDTRTEELPDDRPVVAPVPDAAGSP